MLYLDLVLCVHTYKCHRSSEWECKNLHNICMYLLCNVQYVYVKQCNVYNNVCICTIYVNI